MSGGARRADAGGMTNATTLPIAVSIKEAARLSGIGRTKLYELIKADHLEARKSGQSTLVMVDSLVRYLDSLPKVVLRADPLENGGVRMQEGGNRNAGRSLASRHA